MTAHASEPSMLTPDDAGFYLAACVCGWTTEAWFPDLETAVDELVAHALSVAQTP